MTRKKREEFNFEDAIFDDLAKVADLDHVELPLSRNTFILIIVLVAAIGSAVLGRFFYLNVARGEFYDIRSLANVNKEIIIPAPRGIIADRYGKPLVKNLPSFGVSVNIGQLVKSGSADTALGELAEVLEINPEELAARVKNADLEKGNILSVANAATTDQIISLKTLDLPGVLINSDFAREYQNGPAFAHVLGYDGAVQTGLEAFYDSYLKGEDGLSVIFRDAKGNEFGSQEISDPSAGHRLTTTLDADLQEYFYKRLSDGLRSLGRASGVGIALNPQTGEVLALISLPSFNSNYFSFGGFSKEKTGLLNSPNKPLFNRAVSGLYNPGSTIKPLVALAALREQVVVPDLRIFSRGYIEVPNPYYPDQPSRFVDWKPHGWVDLRSALAKSSNVYFYALGGGLPNTELGILSDQFGKFSGLGIGKLNEYWKRFLLDQKTGIDLPGEDSGFLPDAEEKERRTGEIWRVGDTYNVTIGQGDLLITPIQLASFVGSLANEGKLYRPFLAKEIRSEDGGVIKTFTSTELLDYSDWDESIAEVRKGMEDAVSQWYGTANLLSSLPVTAAGKTGSAQTFNNTKTNAFFVGYAPAKNPQIAILVLVEDAKEGSLNAVPIAKDVLEWYYWNRIQNLGIPAE